MSKPDRRQQGAYKNLEVRRLLPSKRMCREHYCIRKANREETEKQISAFTILSFSFPCGASICSNSIGSQKPRKVLRVLLWDRVKGLEDSRLCSAQHVYTHMHTHKHTCSHIWEAERDICLSSPQITIIEYGYQVKKDMKWISFYALQSYFFHNARYTAFNLKTAM